MAFRKTLAQSFAKVTSSYYQSPTLAPSQPSLLRRLLHVQRRPIFHSAAAVPVPADRFPGIPVGDQIMDRILGLSRDRIRLEGLAPPQPLVTAEEARKAVRAAQMEAARGRLRRLARSCVAYAEFAAVCGEVAAGDEEEGGRLARAMDEAGAVIVLGNVVFLRPELVAKAIEGMIPLSMSPPSDPRRSELKAMEEQKAAIDAQAEAHVKRELWTGLGLLLVQTLGFMRLTFWELSWDVMEPVCFYVTSFYFMAGYAFFLRTSRDPSFEGFFESRFAAKQSRLMTAHRFDLERYNQLRRGDCTNYRPLIDSSSSSPCHRRSTFIGPAH
ncbi:calcium uniporter protein 2, mitochondrial-like [Typha latifolia]|uniref:calcium uniporter protein 2, mitochondrial-like n=1 Tax=Typha latifolia TaxID=4733 RepID=UPI003C2EFCD6